MGKPNKRPLAAAAAVRKKQDEKKASSSSFFDFLIPSFVRGASSKADREGPVKMKKYAAVPAQKRRTAVAAAGMRSMPKFSLHL